MQVHHVDISVSMKFRSTKLKYFQSHKVYTNFYDNQLSN